MITRKEIVRIALSLTAIYVAWGLLLAVVYSFAGPAIFRNQLAERNAALKKLMPNAEKIMPISSWTPHEHKADIFAVVNSGKVGAYIVESYGKGYGGFIHLLVAADTSFKVLEFRILSHNETPGLGDVIETKDFQQRLLGKDAAHLKVVKVPSEEYVQGVTGATISSRGVTEDGVQKAMARLVQSVNEGAGHELSQKD